MLGGLVAAVASVAAASIVAGTGASAELAEPELARPRPGRSLAAAQRVTQRPPQPTPSSQQERVVGYFTSWGIYERGYEVADIPASDLTHVNYAFANVVDGRCAIGDRWADVDRPSPTDLAALPYRGNFNQLQVLKARHPHLKTLLSVGGSTWSGGFPAATANPAARQRFAASCVDLMVRYGFDGLDIDWEYPGMYGGSPADRANFTAFLAELRAQLDRHGAGPTRKLLTIAGPAGAPMMAQLDIPAITSHVDWVNVMTYDFAGPWSPRTGHNAPLFAYPGIEDSTFSVDSTVRRWVAAGASPDRLVVGLAFYGRGYGGVGGSAPGQTFSSIPMGTTEAGMFDYAHLRGGALDGMTVTFDQTARVPAAFDASSGTWISFDDARSIEEKGRYIARNGYGGAMVWELSNDADGELLAAAIRGLAG